MQTVTASGVSILEMAAQSLWASVGGAVPARQALHALMLLSARLATIFAMTPLLYAMPVPARVKVLLVLALSVALASGLSMQVTTDPISDLLGSALREMALGATLALGVQLAFAAFSVGGQLLEIQIGFGMAQVFDPMSNRPSPILVSAFNTLALLVFFLVDGHHALLRGIAYSVERFPVGQAWAIGEAWEPMMKQVSGMFSLGFALAAPAVFSLMLVEMALGVVARNLPQINMLSVGIPVKIVVGVAALSLWYGLMGGVMMRVYSTIYSTWDAIFQGAAAPQPTPKMPHSLGGVGALGVA